MLCQRLVIRHGGESDLEAIRKIVRAAYGRAAEARIAAVLVPAPVHTISLLAECDGVPVGHVLMTEIGAPVRSLVLTPLSVVPRYREMQVGSALVRAGLDAARLAGFDAVFASGNGSFFERFGFSSELADPFTVPWQGNRFMVTEIRPGCLTGRSGQLDYPEILMRIAA